MTGSLPPGLPTVLTPSPTGRPLAEMDLPATLVEVGALRHQLEGLQERHAREATNRTNQAQELNQLRPQVKNLTAEVVQLKNRLAEEKQEVLELHGSWRQKWRGRRETGSRPPESWRTFAEKVGMQKPGCPTWKRHWRTPAGKW